MSEYKSTVAAHDCDDLWDMSNRPSPTDTSSEWTIESAAREIVEWLYSDALVELDLSKTMRCIEQDGTIPTKEECERLALGDCIESYEDDAKFTAFCSRWPNTVAYINGEST